MAILGVDLLFELLDELSLIRDDLGTGSLLCLNVLLFESKKSELVNERYQQGLELLKFDQYLPQPVLCNLPFLQAPASSNRSQHSSYGTE